MAEYRKTIIVDKEQAWAIKKALAWKEGEREDLRLNEDETITETAVFEDGMEMDIKCCGADEGEAWTEAVLFTHGGGQAAMSDWEMDFFGEWELEDEGNLYIVNVIEAA